MAVQNLNILIVFRSTKYSAVMLETLSAPPPPPPPTGSPTESLQLSTEQDSLPSLDLSSTQFQPITYPAATSSPQNEVLNQDNEDTATLDPDQESGPMLYLSESLQESLKTDEVVGPASVSRDETTGQNHTSGTSDPGTLGKEPVPVTVVEALTAQLASPEPSAQQPPRSKKNKLAMLKKLGLDPPPVAKLCPDDGAFVQLEAPQLNPGE